MTQSKAGQIVWHDLFTSDRKRSMDFYQRIANWTYQVERATDFAWGGGEKDFVLALSGDEAGAGFAETPPKQQSGWIAYIEVPDVDAAVANANKLGGKIVRHPFDVPGVGRSALVRDPLGALLGVSLSRHAFPVPLRQFGPEVYVSKKGDFPEAFYAELFGWQVRPERDIESLSILEPSGNPVAVQHAAAWHTGSNSIWVPSIKVASISDACRVAEVNGAHPVLENDNRAAQSRSIILRDPNGAAFVFSVERTSPS